jgi:hypothetical protein
MGEKITVSNDLLQDPNFIAFNQAEQDGVFKDLEPGTYVAFVHGALVGNAPTIEALLALEALKSQEETVLCHQVNLPKEVIDIPTPLFD